MEEAKPGTTAEQGPQAMLLEEQAEHLVPSIGLHSEAPLLPQPLQGGTLWTNPDVLEAGLLLIWWLSSTQPNTLAFPLPRTLYTHTILGHTL